MNANIEIVKLNVADVVTTSVDECACDVEGFIMD